jgi:hypothetical protein
MNITEALEVLAGQMEDRGGELVLNYDGGEVMAAWVVEGVDMTLAGGKTAEAAIINLAEALY